MVGCGLIPAIATMAMSSYSETTNGWMSTWKPRLSLLPDHYHSAYSHSLRLDSISGSQEPKMIRALRDKTRAALVILPGPQPATELTLRRIIPINPATILSSSPALAAVA